MEALHAPSMNPSTPHMNSIESPPQTASPWFGNPESPENEGLGVPPKNSQTGSGPFQWDLGDQGSFELSILFYRARKGQRWWPCTLK